MSTQDYFPIDSNKLSTTFPELKHYILKNFRKTLSIKKGRELKFNKDTDLIYLINGKIKAYLYDQKGHEQLMYLFLKDSIIFHSINEQFYKKLVAVEDATVYIIDEYSIYTFLKSDEMYIDKYLTLIASRYGVLMQQILMANHESAKYKVLSFLFVFSQKYGIFQKDGSIVVPKFPSLTDIGALTNVHRTNVSAYINELESQNIISRTDNTLTILDAKRLRDIIDALAR